MDLAWIGVVGGEEVSFQYIYHFRPMNSQLLVSRLSLITSPSVPSNPNHAPDRIHLAQQTTITTARNIHPFP